MPQLGQVIIAATPRQRTYHTTVRATVLEANSRTVPILLLEDGHAYRPAIAWLCSPKMLKLASRTQSEALRALGLLYDFHRATAATTKEFPRQIDRMLPSFAQAVLLGTIDQNGNCPYQLFWRSRPTLATSYSRWVKRFCSFLETREIGELPVPQSEFTQNSMRSRKATKHQADASILSHLSNSRRTPRPSPPLELPSSHTVNEARPTPFPTQYIIPLLTNGCRRERALQNRTIPELLRLHNIRNQLAFLLILGAGLRTEELFHIFTNDVYAVPGDVRAHVNLYHPVRGAISWRPIGHSSPITTTRDQYLRERFHRAPRNLYDDRDPRWAGWKSLLLNRGAPHYYATVFWIHPYFGDMFLRLHTLYLKHIRVRYGTNHPYYFISLDSRNMGEPWTINGFQEAWQTAVEKIDLRQDKLLGTNPHGGRHWYGQTAADLGIDPRIRQVMMHHKSILSQQCYQIPSAASVNAHLERAHANVLRSMSISPVEDTDELALDQFDPSDLHSFLGQAEMIDAPDVLDGGWFNSRVDPTGVFASWNLFLREA